MINLNKILFLSIFFSLLSGCSYIKEIKNDNNEVRCEKKHESVILETQYGKKFGWGQGK